MKILLKPLRRKYNIRQVDLAKALDISRNSYNQKENGKRKFKPSEMLTIFNIFKNHDRKLKMEDIFF